MSFLVQRLPSRLCDLSLTLSGCNLGVNGARALAEGLPTSMNGLRLYLRSCNIGGRGACFLAKCLPADLRSLSLDLCRCNIGEGGARALAESLPARLRYLSLNFDRDDSGGGIGKGGVLALLEHVPATVSCLRLGCHCFDVIDLGKIWATIPQRGLDPDFSDVLKRLQERLSWYSNTESDKDDFFRLMDAPAWFASRDNSIVVDYP